MDFSFAMILNPWLRWPTHSWLQPKRGHESAWKEDQSSATRSQQQFWLL